jgi:hypothetical protein
LDREIQLAQKKDTKKGTGQQERIEYENKPEIKLCGSFIKE